MSTKQLAVSVVMSVYDQPELVKQTIDNVLAQQGVELEFIIVDDGAEGAVRDVLADYQDEPKIVILSQHNQGLTVALISACTRASKPYIARIDTGDLMVEGRLTAQAQRLEDNARIGMVCSSIEAITSEGYSLYRQDYDQVSLKRGLTTLQVDKANNPFHASLMFRAQTYRQVGGYRPEFYFAQDSDLWARLIEVSELAVINSPLTKGLISAYGISGQYASEQGRLHQLAVEARRCRRDGQSEQATLDAAKAIRPQANGEIRNPFDGLYYIAKCLFDRKSPHAKGYFLRAILAKPWAFKAWVYLLPSLLAPMLTKRQPANG